MKQPVKLVVSALTFGSILLFVTLQQYQDESFFYKEHRKFGSLDNTIHEIRGTEQQEDTGDTHVEEEAVFIGDCPNIQPDLNSAKYEISYLNPKTYKGPIIEGWMPQRSKNMSLYIQPEQSSILPQTSCFRISDNVKILIVVQSAPNMKNRRMANRRSWIQKAKKSYPHIQALFLFGHTSDQNITDLIAERNEFCDLLQMDFVDHYSNVTFDSVMALKLVREKILNSSKNLQFVVIADDDSFINVKLLHYYLLGSNPLLKPDDRKILGRVIGGKVHFPEKNRFEPFEILPYSLWTYSPSYLFNNLTYPDFLSGAGYVIPICALDCIYQASLELPFFHINDVFITGFARRVCNLSLLHDGRRFISGRLPPNKWKDNFIVYHYMTDKKKEVMSKALYQQKSFLNKCGENLFCVKNGKLLYCKSSHSKVDCTEVKL